MGVDRSNYVMSLELAMQREMAYREKLQKGNAEQCGRSPISGSRKDPMPFQVQAPILTTADVAHSPNFCPPTPVLTSNSRAHPSTGPRPQQANFCPPTPVIASNSRAHPSTEPRPQQAPPQRPRPIQPAPTSTPLLIPNPRPLPYVEPQPMQAPINSVTIQHLRPVRPAIQAPVNSLSTQHLQPVRPAIQAPYSAMNRTPRFSQFAHQKRKSPLSHQAHPHKRLQVSSPDDFYCNICEVDCTSEYNIRSHLRGHKHKAKLREVKSQKPVGGASEADGTKIHCELCKIWCTDLNAFSMHLKGKNHILKLYSTEKKFVGPDSRNTVL